MARSTSSPVATPGSAADAAPGRSLALNLLISLRPGQWSKNLVIFAGVLFGRRLFDPGAVIHAVAAFVVFCLLSGVVYLVNDIADRESDRQHPLKAKRPIASGALPVGVAIAAAIPFGASALVAAFLIGWPFAVVAMTYVALQLAYSAALKHIVIIDVLTIAIGFVLRAVAGAAAVNVEISHWLLVGGATSHRPILGEYSAYLLDQMIGVVTASTLISYIFYTISPETQAKFGTPWLGLTIPFPLYGIFRYLYLVHLREGGGSPADLLLTDRPLLTCVALWALAVALIIYHPV